MWTDNIDVWRLNFGEGHCLSQSRSLMEHFSLIAIPSAQLKRLSGVEDVQGFVR